MAPAPGAVARRLPGAAVPWHLPARGALRTRRPPQVYAAKETREAWAWREYGLLRNLRRLGLPTVEPVGVVTGRETAGGEELEPCLLTRHLPHSLPYRALFSQRLQPDTIRRVIDALVVLLVRLHVEGFWWGDCSLSNTLFRRSAGEFAAYLVDAETGELHDRLSDGQRGHDLDLVTTNVFGELLDLQAGGLLDEELEPDEMVARIKQRYDALWDALTGAEEFDTERDVAHRAAGQRVARARLRRRGARHRHRLRRLHRAHPAGGRGGRPPHPPAAGPHRPRRRGAAGAPAARRPGRVHRGGRACRTRSRRSSPTAG